MTCFEYPKLDERAYRETLSNGLDVIVVPRTPNLQPGSCGSLTMHSFASAPPARLGSGLDRARAGGLDSEAPRSPPPIPQVGTGGM